MTPTTDLTLPLQRSLRALPDVPGQGVVVAVVLGHGGLWELTWAGAGQAPASAAALEALASAWSSALEGEGLRPTMPPRGLPGATLPAAPGALVVVTPRGQVQARGFAPELGKDPLQACRSIQAVRQDSEAAVLRLGAGLRDVLTTSREQCDEMADVVRRFEAQEGGDSASLSSTLQALESEVRALGENLQDRLGRQRKEAEGAASWASDIIQLATSVDQIAQSARLLTFNARIESARLGEQGKGFVVIANAIRDLASDVRTSNEVVTRLATSLAATLPELQKGTSALANDTDQRLSQLRARLEEVRTSFEATRQQTLTGLRASETAARGIRDKSHEVVQDLQFQDRASQLLRHAMDQVEALERVLGLAEEAPADLIKRVGDLGRKLDGQVDVLQPSTVELF